jgi:hypothetical protein
MRFWRWWGSSDLRRRALLGALLVLETLGLAYAALVAWLLSAWFLDDHAAASMVASDWWRIAGQRFLLCTAAAVCLAALIFVINRFAMRRVPGSRLPYVTAIVFFAIVVGASFAGALGGRTGNVKRQ